jgi:hypothetical protein
VGTAGEERRFHPPSGAGDIGTVIDRHRTRLHALPGVVAVALGRAPTGEDAIVVYLSNHSAVQAVPSEIDGHPVQTVVTGPIEAL